MKSFHFFLFVLVAAVSAGCSTSPQQRARDEQARQARVAAYQVEKQQQEEKWMNDLKAKCIGYGFKPNTPEFSNCLMKVDQDTKAANRAWFAEQDRQIQKQFDTARELAKPPEFLQPNCPSVYNGGVRRQGC
jgi:hypothetical protein